MDFPVLSLSGDTEGTRTGWIRGGRIFQNERRADTSSTAASSYIFKHSPTNTSSTKYSTETKLQIQRAAEEAGDMKTGTGVRDRMRHSYTETDIKGATVCVEFYHKKKAFQYVSRLDSIMMRSKERFLQSCEKTHVKFYFLGEEKERGNN